MSWNPMMGPAGASSDPMQGLAQALGQYKPNQLGAGVTLGNPQAQQDYAQQLAQALADGQFSAKQIETAASMMTPDFIQNSGIAGVADMILKTYAGKKMDEKARKLQADAEARRMTAQEGVDERKAERDAARSEAISTRERTRRESVARQMGLNNREAVEFIETGKVPQAVRMNTVQGEDGYLYNVDPYNSTGQRVQVGGTAPASSHVRATYTPMPGEDPADGKAAFEAAVAAAEGRGLPPPNGDTVDVGRVRAPQFLRGKQPEADKESYGQPQPVTGADGKVQMVQFGNRGGQRVVEGYAPPPTARDAKPPTEGERNAAGYYSRMDAAGRELDALTNAGYDPGNMRDHYTAGQGPLLNWAASEEGQRYRQQQEDWVRAKLRKESGAVIGDEEMEREIRTYFPQPGDKPEVLKAKAGSRKIAEEAMRKSGGRAVEPANADDEDLIRKYL